LEDKLFALALMEGQLWPFSPCSSMTPDAGQADTPESIYLHMKFAVQGTALPKDHFDDNIGSN
jgi:hypothetical protein